MKKIEKRIFELHEEAANEMRMANALASVFGGKDETVQFCLARRARLLDEAATLQESIAEAKRKREVREWIRKRRIEERLALA